MPTTAIRGRALYIPRPASFATQVAAAGGGPFLWWRLGETSGTSAADSSAGASNTGTYETGVSLGQTGLVTGDTDKAVGLNTTSGRVLKLSGIGGWPTSALTAFIIVKPSAVGTDQALFTHATVDTGFGSTWAFYLAQYGTGKYEGALFSGTTQRVVATATGVATNGTRQVLAIRGDATSVDLWQNGSQVATTSGLPGSLNGASSAAIVVGDWWQNGGTHGRFGGVADEAILWGSKLSDADLSAVMAAA